MSSYIFHINGDIHDNRECNVMRVPKLDTMRRIIMNTEWPKFNTEKTLVDANKIKAVIPCCEPVDGDLVRINTDHGYFVNGVVVAVCCTWATGSRHYTTENGKIYCANDVEVLEIIGKCVFSVYA